MSSISAHILSEESVDEVDSSDSVEKGQKTIKDSMQEISVSVSNMWQQFLVSLDQIMEDYGVYGSLGNMAKQLVKHPFLAFMTTALLLSVALPFVMFLMFSISTVIMAFFGFVVVEGTLITIASVMLFGFLGTVILLFLFFGSIVMSGYFLFIRIYDFVFPSSLTMKFHQPHRHSHHHAHSRPHNFRISPLQM